MSEFKPMRHESQGASDDILFIKADAEPMAIWESAYSRFDAVRQLSAELAITANDRLDHTPLAIVSSILLSDAMSLFNALYPAVRDATKNRERIEDCHLGIDMVMNTLIAQGKALATGEIRKDSVKENDSPDITTVLKDISTSSGTSL